MHINKIKFIFIEFVLFLERFFRIFKSFWKEKEIVFGKWLCKRYGNCENFLKSYSPKMKYKIEKWSQIPDRWDFHIPYRMVFSNNMFSFSYPEAQPKKQNALINALWKIDGIKYIEISAYKIHITIGTIFQFEDLKPKILWIIEKYAPKANF